MKDHTLQHLPYARWAHVLLRFITGAVIAQHGAQKLFGVLDGHVAPVGSLFWFAGIIELVGGALVFIGLCTRPVAFLVSGEMAVAYFKVHFPQNFWPVLNKGEIVVLLCFNFLYFAATGAGAFSLDYFRARGKVKPTMP